MWLTLCSSLMELRCPPLPGTGSWPLLQAAKSVLSVPNTEVVNTQSDVERMEIREQTKSKSEAKWKYKVRCVCVG